MPMHSAFASFASMSDPPVPPPSCEQTTFNAKKCCDDLSNKNTANVLFDCKNPDAKKNFDYQMDLIKAGDCARDEYCGKHDEMFKHYCENSLDLVAKKWRLAAIIAAAVALLAIVFAFMKA